MRVTDKVLYQNSTARLNSTRSRWARAQEIAQSGIRVNKPSDDPYAAARAVRESHTQRSADAVAKIATAASTRIQGADTALQSVNDLLSRARELATQGANSTLSPENRAAMAQEIQGIREQMIQLGNTRIGESYVFGGMGDGSPPFDSSGSFSGNTTVRRLQVGENTFVNDGVSGAEIFGTSSGTNIFDTLSAIETALAGNDRAGVEASLGDLESATNQVTQSRSSLGTLMNQFDAVSSAAERTSEIATTNRSQLVDADVFQAYNDFASAQRALEAAVQIASELPMPGLVTGRR